MKDRDAVCAGCTCSKLCFKRFSCLVVVVDLIVVVVAAVVLGFCFYGSDCLAFHFHVAQLPPVAVALVAVAVSAVCLAPARGATVI